MASSDVAKLRSFLDLLARTAHMGGSSRERDGFLANQLTDKLYRAGDDPATYKLLNEYLRTLVALPSALGNIQSFLEVMLECTVDNFDTIQELMERVLLAPSELVAQDEPPRPEKVAQSCERAELQARNGPRHTAAYGADVHEHQAGYGNFESAAVRRARESVLTRAPEPWRHAQLSPRPAQQSAVVAQPVQPAGVPQQPVYAVAQGPDPIAIAQRIPLPPASSYYDVRIQDRNTTKRGTFFKKKI